MKNLCNFIFAIFYRNPDGTYATTEYRRIVGITMGNARVYRSRICNMQSVIKCIIYKEIF